MSLPATNEIQGAPTDDWLCTGATGRRLDEDDGSAWQ
jgi:hypothetical protein